MPPEQARRFVVVTQGAMPSTDYLVRPWLHRLGPGVPVVEVDAGPTVSTASEPLRDGDWVVLVRYLTPAWRRHLERHRARLAGLAYFMDDDLLDAGAHTALPAPYARKLRALAVRQGPWLARHCSAVWVSSPALAQKYAGLRPQVLPLAPSLSLRAPPSMPAASSSPVPDSDEAEASGAPAAGPVRVAYHGSASHGAEIAWLRPVIAAVQARCAHTHFELVGDHAVNKAWRGLPRTTVLHPMSWPNYLAHTRAQRCQIGLAPLLPGPFAAGRCAVKFFDYARMGAAGVYSDVAPYAGFVRDGVDGLLLPNEPQAWVEALVALAEAPARLAALAAGATRRALVVGEGGALADAAAPSPQVPPR